MKVLQVKEYNTQQKAKWHKACDEHITRTYIDFYNSPQLAFYCFFTNQGQYRQTGYVAFADNSAVWRKSKREVIEAFEK